jgi:phosphatidylserine/phosphatidylglycerophosphate/cardiolipin synthase-like enzyme
MMVFKRILLLVFLLQIPFQTFAEDRMRFLFADKEALQARIDIVQQAQKEILVEYFSVWNDDQSIAGIALLVDAARRGVKVKIIVDALANSIPYSLFAALIEHGIDGHNNRNLEIKVYNPAYSLNLLKLTHRDHAKMLVVDSETVITGGRNIGDKYFGLSKQRNFDDLDVIAQGDIVPRMRENFLAVWNSKVVAPQNLYEYSRERLEPGWCLSNAGEAQDQCERQQAYAKSQLDLQFQRIKENLERFLTPGKGPIADSQTGKDWLKDSHAISEIQFFSHEPTELVDRHNNYMSQDLLKLIAKTERELVMIAPYLIPTPDLMKQFTDLLRRGIKIKVVTNSLRSTDNLFAQAGYRKYKQQFIRMGFEIHEYIGPNTIHAKAAIIDGKISLVGTYNVDPRSAYINREIGLGFEESESHHPITDELQTYFDIYFERSLLVGKNGVPYNADQEFAGVSPGKVAALKAINFILPLIEGQL